MSPHQQGDRTVYQVWSGGTPICVCDSVSTAQILLDILNGVTN